MDRMDMLVLLVEFFGTFLLLISIFVTGNALIIGGTLALVIVMAGGISGGHMNPAVSVAMWINGSLTLSECVAYAISQTAGGVAAYYAYSALA